ncbi:MAG TPA: ABC transporter permease [Bryobacteraceae bacterium]|nr:ABC transporter permease [Bryobacteraceae bacterium]
MSATPSIGLSPDTRPRFSVTRYWLDVALALESLVTQKTRTFLTALGIIFGVGAVIGMLAIGAGAREESLRFIEQLGVHNVLVESRPASSQEEFQQRRRSSPGLTERDVRILTANVDGLDLISPRRSIHPQRVLPRPAHDMPELYGVRPSYAGIHNWQLEEGSLFDARDDEDSAAVCVLGEAAKTGVLGYGAAVGKFVKVNDTWLQVIGVLRPQVESGGDKSGGPDANNIIYVPLNTFQYRFWAMGDNFKDELDGVDLRLKPAANSVESARVVSAILNSTHHDTQDFTVTIPAALLAEQQRSQTIFTYVMVAIAAISLLVGGIGIMNIVLATVLERTREIGVRRAAGARRSDIVRQFLIESVLISIGGGLLGVAFGFGLSWLIAHAAQWRTIVTTSSILMAFGVSAAVGLVFGIYPALKASRIDPIEALRYE